MAHAFNLYLSATAARRLSSIFLGNKRVVVCKLMVSPGAFQVVIYNVIGIPRISLAYNKIRISEPNKFHVTFLELDGYRRRYRVHCNPLPSALVLDSGDEAVAMSFWSETFES